MTAGVAAKVGTAASGERVLRFLPVRDDRMLVELDDLSSTLSLFAALKQQPVAGVTDLVPAARTLLVGFDPLTIAAADLAAAIASLSIDGQGLGEGEIVDIPVHYDGEDLEDVAELVGVTRDEVVALHTGSDYLVAFTGFAPGFAYLAGGDARLNVPRRKTPRTKVPAGTVAIAGEFSGVYPKASPGGWQMIGTTPLAMFDLNRTPASLLRPGNRVRFHDAGKRKAAPVAAPQVQQAASGHSGQGAKVALEIVSTFMPILFQDLGRHGLTDQGISASGAADKTSLKAANRLVGNAAGEPVLELTFGQAEFKATGRLVIAVTGAPVAVAVSAIDGSGATFVANTAIALEAGDVVRLGMPSAGLRSYLAVRGGFAVEPVLGSAARDTLAELGPAPLVSGDVIAIKAASPGALVGETGCAQPKLPVAGDVVTLDVHFGPRTDWFTTRSVDALCGQDWLVGQNSNRIGLRLKGDALDRTKLKELPSEATVQGAIQVPADGQPVLFLADHPLTGGYPVIANVARHHLDLAGQIPTGARVRFNAIGAFAEIEPSERAAS